MQPTERAFFLGPPTCCTKYFSKVAMIKNMICIFVSNWQQQRGGGVRSLIPSDPTELLLPCQARVVPPTHCVKVSEIFRGNYHNIH